jgi:hypothetical protein
MIERRAWQARLKCGLRGHDPKNQRRVQHDVRPTLLCKNRFPAPALSNRNGVIRGCISPIPGPCTAAHSLPEATRPRPEDSLQSNYQ